MKSFLFDHALLPGGWAHDVRIDVDEGAIVAVQPAAARDGAERIAGIAIPGMPNLHCHAFQRAMAGLAERRGPTQDSFWTWREVMYGFLAALTRLHKGQGAGVGWILLVDAVAGSIVLLAMSGLLLWSRLEGRRLVMLGGALAPLALAALLAWPFF